MGSYYIWLYVQFLWLLPVFHRIYLRTRANMVVPIAISAAIEILFSIVASTERFGNFPDYIWRLFVGRYVFITYIAYLIVEDKFVKKRRYVLLAFIGACFSLLIRYQTVETFPWFYSTEAFAWLGFHWPMYFYSGAIFCVLYRIVKDAPASLKRSLGWMGRNSWPIFLSQMLFFSTFDLTNMGFDSDFITLSIFLIFSFTFSIVSAQIYMLGAEGVSRLRHSNFALGASR